METKRIFRHKQDDDKELYCYTACGLENVYLLNGYTLYQLEDGEGVSVRDLDDLHRAIGQSLAAQHEPLRPRELRWFRLHVDATQAQLAEILGCPSEMVIQWEKGRCSPSEKHDLLIRLLYLDHIDDTAGLQALLERLKKPQPPTRWMIDQAA